MKINTLTITATGVLFYMNVFCQSVIRYPVALPYVGLTAYSTQQNDPLSFTANQGALATVQHAGIGLYSERRFLLAETSAYAAAVVIPTKQGNFGLVLNYVGFKNFNENKIGLAYARNLGSKVAVGIQFNHYGYRIPTYGNAACINFEAGAVIHFSDKLNGGFHVYNPIGGKLGNEGEKLASAYKFGFGYDASDNFFIAGEIIKEEDNPVNVIAGFQYRFAQQFFVRAGISSATSSVFAGAGVAWKKMRVDVSGSYHPQLGFSPGILLVANFGNKNFGSNNAVPSL